MVTTAQKKLNVAINGFGRIGKQLEGLCIFVFCALLILYAS